MIARCMYAFSVGAMFYFAAALDRLGSVHRYMICTLLRVRLWSARTDDSVTTNFSSFTAMHAMHKRQTVLATQLSLKEPLTKIQPGAKNLRPCIRLTVL